MAIIRAFGGTMPRLHHSAFAIETAMIVGDVEIGEQSSLWCGVVVRGDVNFVRVGARTNIQDGSVLHVTSRTHPAVVGDEVTVGHRVVLHGCTVKDRCLVGMGAIVLDGAVVGEDAMVAAGALVPPNMVVPPRTLAVGVPARVKRDLSQDEIASIRGSAHAYVRYAEQYLAEGWSAR